jgi:Tol biopolymer transport system component
MKQITLLIGLLIFINSCNTGTNKKSTNQKDDSQENLKIDKRKLAFQNNEFISCYDFTTGKTVNLTEGSDPCISPDGKWIVFTQSSTTEKDNSRIIKLINTENTTTKDLGIDNKNHYGAIWSPTGEYLAFSIMTNNWQIGLIKPNGSDFKIISTDSNSELYAPTWSQDGKYIYAHNLNVLYKFDTNGKLIDHYDFSQLFGEEFYISTCTRFCFTSDNKKMIFDEGVNESIEGLYEQSSAIFCYDFSTKSTKRISKKGLCATDLWIDKQDQIYFSGFENINDARKIYQTNLTDTTLIECINGMRPSIGQSNTPHNNVKITNN